MPFYSAGVTRFYSKPLALVGRVIYAVNRAETIKASGAGLVVTDTEDRFAR